MLMQELIWNGITVNHKPFFFSFPAAVLQIKMKTENAFPTGVEEERE